MWSITSTADITNSPHSIPQVPDRNRPLLLGSVLITCILLDQLTKALAKIYLSPLISSVYLDGALRLVYAHNSGVMLSLGVGWPEPVKFWLFGVIPAVLFVSLLVTVLVWRALSTPAVIGAGLLIGGGMSNLLDRLLHQGMVIDFVSLSLLGRSTSIFNLADLQISLGLVLLSGLLLLGRIRGRDGTG